MPSPASDPTPDPISGLAAVILTGGSGRRLGGVDKATIELSGSSLLEHALEAIAAAEEAVVVGPEVPCSRPVVWTREDPVGGGPAAGLLAGLDVLRGSPPLVCVLAVDMPRVTDVTVSRLVEALASDAGAASDGAVLVDSTGHEQPLAAVYRLDALQRNRPTHRDDEHGMSIRRLVRGLRLVPVPEVSGEARDVDTWEDLRDLTD